MTDHDNQPDTRASDASDRTSTPSGPDQEAERANETRTGVIGGPDHPSPGDDVMGGVNQPPDGDDVMAPHGGEQPES